MSRRIVNTQDWEKGITSGKTQGCRKEVELHFEYLKSIYLDALTKIYDQDIVDNVFENVFTNERSKDELFRIMNLINHSYNEQIRRDKATVEKEEKGDTEEVRDDRVKSRNLIKPKRRTTHLGPHSHSRATMELKKMNELLLKLLNQ